MIAPAAMMIETARDQLSNEDYQAKNQWILESQMKEVRFAVSEQPDEFYAGYMLGVETARVLLAGMPNAVIHKVSI